MNRILEVLRFRISTFTGLYLGAYQEHQIETAGVAGHQPQISAQVMVRVRGYAPAELFELAGDSTLTRRSRAFRLTRPHRCLSSKRPTPAQAANIHGQHTFAQTTICVVIDHVPVSLPRGELRWGSRTPARRAGATKSPPTKTHLSAKWTDPSSAPSSPGRLRQVDQEPTGRLIWLDAR